MPLIPCLKHQGSYILYIKIDQDKIQLICEECYLLLQDQNLNVNYQGLIHIKSAFKSPQLLLQNLKYSSDLQVILNEFDKFKFNESHINSLLNNLKTQITNIQNMFQAVQQELEQYTKQFLNMKLRVKDEFEKIIQFNQFKQIIANLENQGDSINTQVIEQNEKILYQYLLDLKNIDHKELYFTLYQKIQVIRIELNILNQQQYQFQILQQQFQSFNNSQQEFVKQIKEKAFESFKFFETKILSDQYQYQLISTIESRINKKIVYFQQIYLSTRDGLNGQAFWNKVNQKSNLLMIFKSNSGYICGAFSPCQWICNCNGSYGQDDTLSSFIFSQTHNQIYPIKQGQKGYAIYPYQSYGPTFGGGHDIHITTDFQGSYSNLGHSYQCDQYQISNKSTHLFGQSTPNIVECEILMLTFV